MVTGMDFLIGIKPDILISNYNHDILVGLYYDKAVYEQPRICLKAAGDEVDVILRGLKQHNLFVLEDVGLIFLLKNYEVGECIGREIFLPVATAFAMSYINKNIRNLNE